MILFLNGVCDRLNIVLPCNTVLPPPPNVTACLCSYIKKKYMLFTEKLHSPLYYRCHYCCCYCCCYCRDLLSDDRQEKLDIKMSPEGGLHLPGLLSYQVQSVDDVNQVTK